jgi:hypothetical protein
VTKSFEERLRAIEARLNRRDAARPGGPMVTLFSYGGLMPEPIIATTDNGGEWFRDYPNEELEAFADRCGKEATEMGAQRMLITSMPQGDRQREVASAAHKIYMDLYYPEVPDPEPEGYRRPSPVQRAIERRGIDR